MRPTLPALIAMAAKFHTVFFLCFLAVMLSFAGEEREREFKATRTSKRITVDGRLDEPAWKESEIISELIQREPREGMCATEATEIRILYNDEYLFIGANCSDSSPDKIVANEMRRDEALRNDDFFEIFIDSYHDHRNAFYFVTNPLGAKRDGLVREEGSNINRDWDGLWYVKTHRSESGWTAEFAIPFYTFRFSGAANQTWGINFGRQIARKKEECYWAPVLRDYGHMGKFRVSYYGNLVGLADIKQGKKLHVMPYVIGGGIREEGDASMDFSGDAGLDIKYGLTPNLTADISINTDFAQVEADQEQFNLTRFLLYFPEKRTFFLEGAEVFRVAEKFRFHEPPGLFLFYSRRIGLSEEGGEVPVIGGVRITGKSGKYDLGVLNMMTDRITLETDGVVERMERSNYAVFRIKRDFLKKSTLGIMLLSKDSLDSSHYNRGLAFDYNLAFGHAVRIEGFAAKTFSPDARGKDWAAHMNLSYNTDFWSILLVYLDVGENFNAEMGYVPRLDQKKYRANIGVSPRPGIFNLRQTHIARFWEMIARRVINHPRNRGVFKSSAPNYQWRPIQTRVAEWRDELVQIGKMGRVSWETLWRAMGLNPSAEAARIISENDSGLSEEANDHTPVQYTQSVVDPAGEETTIKDSGTTSRGRPRKMPGGKAKEKEE